MPDEENLEMLLEIRQNIYTTLRQVTAAPKPSYSIDGQKTSWGEYLGQLTRALKEIDAQIAHLDQGEITSYIVP